MVNMGTMVGIDLVKSLVNFVFKLFDGYITSSLGPAGSQIRKKEILEGPLDNFFFFAFRATTKNSASPQKNTEPIALIKKFVR